MSLRLTLILSAVFLFGAFSIGALFTTQACFMAGAGTGYPSLQQAIDRAEPGCTIILLGGTYTENVVVDKPLRIVPRAHSKPFALLGQHPPGTSSVAAFIDPASPSALRAADPDQPVIEIRASEVEIHGLRTDGGQVGIYAANVGDVRLIDNTIVGAADAGIRFDGVRASALVGNTISRASIGLDLQSSQQVRAIDNVVRRNGQGIRLTDASSHTLRGNEVSHSQTVGLHLRSASHNRVTANAIVDNAPGIVMADSSGNRLAANRLDRNDGALRVRGTEITHYVHEIARDNLVNGRPIYYLVDARGVAIGPDADPGYLALIRSRDVRVRGVRLPEGSQGLLMIDTRDSRVENVAVPASAQGLYLQASHDNEIVNARIERTRASGVTLAHASGNRLAESVVRANDGHGILLQDGSANTLVDNEVRDNPDSGVFVSGSRGVRLIRNRIRNNWVGVYLQGGGEHRLTDNAIAKSQFAVFVEGTATNRFENNRLTDNRHASNRPALLEASADESTP